MADQDQDKTMRETEHSQAAVLQRMRRISRRVWNRSHWGSAMTRRWRLLLRRLGRQEEAAGPNEG